MKRPNFESMYQGKSQPSLLNYEEQLVYLLFMATLKRPSLPRVEDYPMPPNLSCRVLRPLARHNPDFDLESMHKNTRQSAVSGYLNLHCSSCQISRTDRKTTEINHHFHPATMFLQTFLPLILAPLIAATPTGVDRRQTMSSNDVDTGNCKDTMFIFARGSTETGNMVSPLPIAQPWSLLRIHIGHRGGTRGLFQSFFQTWR